MLINLGKNLKNTSTRIRFKWGLKANFYNFSEFTLTMKSPTGIFRNII